MATSTKFIAFPNVPPEIGATIATATEQLRKYAQGTQIMLWPELDIAGHFLAHEILGQIDNHDCFVGDTDVRYLFIGSSKTIDYEGLVIRFIDHGVIEEDWSRLIDVLLWYGIIGYAKDADESIYIHDTSYNLKLLKGLGSQFKTRGKLFSINPAFWAGLQLSDDAQSTLLH